MAGEPEKLCRQCGGSLHVFGGVSRCGNCGLPADAVLLYEVKQPVQPAIAATLAEFLEPVPLPAPVQAPAPVQLPEVKQPEPGPKGPVEMSRQTERPRRK